MSSALPVLLVGVLLGAALGWLAHAHRRPCEPSPPPIPTVDPGLIRLESAVSTIGGQLRELEQDRAVSYASLASQVQAMTRTSTRLTDRTDQLVTALRAPQVRGRWGEIQLERVVELAGGRRIIVDAKVPFVSYLDALDSQDPEEHGAYLRRHAHLLRTHVTQLAAKDYIDAFTPTPEFVVLFVPADPFLDAALGVDPELLEYAFSRNIVIATPTTLFALLRTVALGWRQEDISEKARDIQRLGRELYKRLNTMGDHYNRVGRQLENTIEAYNSTLTSLDSRVMVTARHLADLDVPARTDRHPTRPEQIITRPRDRSSPTDEDSGLD
ncbi:DNA recombination protein RmuC [Corynebacterium marinum]|uniref:Putative RmuC domain protein n=1 Tax=Corynebacterium marinum DSM 44953 TaxID=1224162 RepID=A0A0B6TUM5_9CORY|nr:DNA recombination protein RmuC [Corynebacterium marinum]AJK68421.1 putative RmuC domain protein [Corynebacterium marinum DSM 44953]GGO15305.1 hypothetical protein GCM10010980_10680 [Corynebacterium marinum]